jgi:hypothetical protein
MAAAYVAELGYNEEVGRYGMDSRSFTYLTPHEARRLNVPLTVVPATIPWRTFAGVDLRKRPTLPKVASKPAFKPTAALVEGIKGTAEKLSGSRPTKPWPADGTTPVQCLDQRYC